MTAATRMAVVECGTSGCLADAFVLPGEDVFAFRARIEAAGWYCRAGRWLCPADSGLYRRDR